MNSFELRPITEIPSVNYAIESIEQRVYWQYGIHTNEEFRYYLEAVLLDLLNGSKEVKQ